MNSNTPVTIIKYKKVSKEVTYNDIINGFELSDKLKTLILRFCDLQRKKANNFFIFVKNDNVAAFKNELEKDLLCNYDLVELNPEVNHTLKFINKNYTYFILKTEISNPMAKNGKKYNYFAISDRIIKYLTHKNEKSTKLPNDFLIFFSIYVIYRKNIKLFKK